VSDQPEPTSDEPRSAGLREYVRQQRQPQTASGKWTNVDVEALWEKGGSIAVKDAINAAIAAERQMLDQVLIAEQKRFTEQLTAEKQRCANVLAMDADREREMERLEQQLAAAREALVQIAEDECTPKWILEIIPPTLAAK
jgi:hypothetical protein